MTTKPKEYQFTVTIRSSMKIADIIWTFTNKLKHIIPILSISYTEVEDRPTTTEHHGGTTE